MKVTRNSAAQLAPSIFFLLLLMLWVLGVTWGSGYADPNYRQALAHGNAHRDTLFHSAYAAMLRTYNIPSTGLDGLPFVPYHFGSHWLAAQIARVFNLSALTVYHHIYPVLLPSLLIGAFLWFVAGLQPRVQWRSSMRFWTLLVIGITGVFPPAIGAYYGLWTSSWVSESNALAFAILFLIAGMLVRGATRYRMFLWLALPFACLAIGISKQSTLYLGVAVLAYLFVIFQGYRRPAWILSALLVLAMCIPSYYVSKGLYNSADIMPLDFLNTYIEGSPLLWLLLNFGWSWVFIILRLRERQPPYTDVGVIVTLCVAGIIPALLLRIPGGSAFYFVDLQRFVALAFLLAWFPQRTLRRRWQQTVVVWGTALAVIWVAAWVCAHVTLSTANLVGRGQDEANHRILDQLDQLAALDDKAHTALLIPRDHPYWSLLPDCRAIPFLAPAYTGLALINGLPDDTCPPIDGYSYNAYAPDTRPVCQKVRQYGLSRLVVLDDLTHVTTLAC